MRAGGNAGADLGQFFTPRPVAEFMWAATGLLEGRPGSGLRVVDPAAGLGIFLQVGVEQGLLRPEDAWGIEVDPSLVARLPRVLAGARFLVGDGLFGDFPGVEEGSFDRVFGNPPFGRLGGLLGAMGAEAPAQWRQRFAAPLVPRRPEQAPADLLFLERALQLVRPGGLVAFVLPEGFFANARLQAARDWVRQRARVLAVVALPGSVFRGRGLNARAAVLFVRRGRRGRKPAALISGGEGMSLEAYLGGALEALGGGEGAGVCCVRAGERTLQGQRWDPRSWQGRLEQAAVEWRFAARPLGDFIAHLTYGPIVTGRRPQPVPAGVRLIHQGDFAETGLRFKAELCVAPGCEYDPPRSRVQRRDLLLPRSGAGALGRNRLAVYLGAEPANIGCFVDLVRLEGLNPFYAWFFLKARHGRRQIEALINGVGTPNINFAEIRSLRIAAIPPCEQQHLEERYWLEVWPLHQRGSEGEAVHRFRRIVADLEAFLEGKRRGTAACPGGGS